MNAKFLCVLLVALAACSMVVADKKAVVVVQEAPKPPPAKEKPPEKDDGAAGDAAGGKATRLVSRLTGMLGDGPIGGKVKQVVMPVASTVDGLTAPLKAKLGGLGGIAGGLLNG